MRQTLGPATIRISMDKEIFLQSRDEKEKGQAFSSWSILSYRSSQSENQTFIEEMI